MALLKKDFAYAQILHANDGSSKVPKYLPNFDWFYGPYVSKEAAFAALSSDAYQMCIGKTVGIIENGTIVEYWFESACSTVDDLVEKKSVPELTIEQMNDLLNRAIDSDGTVYPKYEIEGEGDSANIVYYESAGDEGEIVYPAPEEPESGSNEVQGQNPEENN